MKTLFKFATDHKEVITSIYFFKSIVKSVLSVVLIVLLMTTVFNPFQMAGNIKKVSDEVSEAQDRISQTANYLTGDSDDATNVPESFVNIRTHYQATQEDISRIADSISEYRQNMAQ